MKMLDLLLGRSMFYFAEDDGSGGGGVVETPENSEAPETPESPETPEVPESPETPEPEGERSWEQELEEKGAESIIKESRRMREKIAKLEKERTPEPAPAAPEKPKPEVKPEGEGEFEPVKYLERLPRGKAAIAHLKRMGMDAEGIAAFVDLVGLVASPLARAQVEPIASEFRETRFTRALSEFSKEDENKFAMSKPEVRKEVESYIRNTFRPEQWADKEVMEAALGRAIKKNLSLFSQGKREIVEGGAIHEKGGTGGTGSVHGIADTALKAYAESIGYSANDMKDPEIRKSVTAAYKAQMAAQKQS